MRHLQEIIDNLDLCRQKQLIGRINHAFCANDFVQVVLDVISDEAEYVKKIDLEEDIFDTNCKNLICYVKRDSFVDFISENEFSKYENKYEDYSLENEKNTIERILENKLVLIKPYFYYSEAKETFFKNGNVAKLIDIDRDYVPNYLAIPIIKTEETFKKLVAGDPFALTINPESIMGRPEYLYYDGRLFKVDLVSLPQNDSYWKLNTEVSDNLIELDYEANLYFEEDMIYGTNNNFVFLSLDVILNSKRLNEIDEVEEKKQEVTEVNTVFNISKEAEILDNFLNFTMKKNLSYQKNDIYNFHTCIKSSQLVILAGMSGTGKTKLPLRYAEYFNMNEEEKNLLFVPISPSFTEPSDVLGFLNPNTNFYVSSETGLVEFLKHAEDNPNKMHMVIFDEMNLAQIEFWFAPFISILEKDLKNRYIRLYNDEQQCLNKEQYPSKILVGKNVSLVGTINLDETTKNISDRLLDRSYIINLKKESFANYQAQQASVTEDISDRYEGDFYQDLMPNYDIDETSYINNFNLRQLEFFDKVHEELNKVDSEKGVSFRSVKNISFFISNRPTELNEKLAFDYAFKQTVMKKINGSIDSLDKFLGRIDENGDIHGVLSNIFDSFSDVSEFKECRAEIKNKINELRKYGYTR